MRVEKIVVAGLLSSVVMAIGAATASAATLSSDGTTITYTAAAGDVVNSVSFSSGAGYTGAPGEVAVGRFDSDPITPGAGCHQDPSYGLVCDGTRIVANLGGGNDVFGSGQTDVPATVDAGDGDDRLYDGPAADVLYGGAGQDNFGTIMDGAAMGGGADRLDGGPGDDIFTRQTPGDRIAGGSGVDRLFVSAPTGSAGGSFSLNDVADDGQVDVGPKIDVRSDVEDLVNAVADTNEWGLDFLGTGHRGALTLRGNGQGNRLTGSESGDDIDGLAGNDVLVGSKGDDTLRSVDGSIDRLECGLGVDTAIADTRDVVSESCETVTRQDVRNADGVATPAIIADDAPPSVSLSAPAALISGPNTFRASARDDHGVAAVRFYDDDRLVCSDTAAPYTCVYTPTGGDVGRNTFTAEALDTAGQTATVRTGGIVPKFGALGVTARAKAVAGRRSTKVTASGELKLPAGVTAANGCTGVVTVDVRRGRRLLSKRTTALTQTCAFRSTVKLRGVRGAKGLRVKPRFGGNDVMAPQTGTVMRPS